MACERIQNLALSNCVTMMCAEREAKLACHRTILIQPIFAKQMGTMWPICRNGALESIMRTPWIAFSTHWAYKKLDMFKSRLGDSCRSLTIQGDRIAYDPMKQVRQLSAGRGDKVRVKLYTIGFTKKTAKGNSLRF